MAIVCEVKHPFKGEGDAQCGARGRVGDAGLVCGQALNVDGTAHKAKHHVVRTQQQRKKKKLQGEKREAHRLVHVDGLARQAWYSD